MDEQSKFRPVNTTLGTTPSFGALPGNQLIPWALLSGLVYIIGQSLLSLGWFETGFLWIWLIGSWWLLTGNHPWKFLSKFQKVPNWSRGYAQYQPLLGNGMEALDFD